MTIHTLGQEVCAVLGLDPARTRTITITIEPGCVPMAVAEQYVFEDDTTDGLVKVLRTFEVLERVDDAS